jgi:hypothetical protein
VAKFFHGDDYSEVVSKYIFGKYLIWEIKLGNSHGKEQREKKSFRKKHEMISATDQKYNGSSTTTEYI